MLERLKTQKNLKRFILGQILWRSQLCRLFIINRGQYRLRFFPTALSMSYWFDENERKGDETFIGIYLRQGDCMIDVGANIGALTLVAAQSVGNNGQVVSIEAHPTIFTYLKKNISLNQVGNVKLINMAVGNEEGEVSFSNKRSDDQNEVTYNDKHTITVSVDRLDDILVEGAYERIHLLKVDVEGYEKFVFEGGERTLQKTDCVYFESWEQHFVKHGYSSRDCLNLLREQGFEVYQQRDGQYKPVATNYTSQKRENLFAIRDLSQFLTRIEGIDSL